jgi:GT2 family glycosyltransferase
LRTTAKNTEIILVNNHPPYREVKQFLSALNHPRIKVWDPGRNLGCTTGFQYGASHARGQYVIKLDDDTIVPANNWIEAMFQVLQDYQDLAYVALVVPIYKLGRFAQAVRPQYTFEFYDDIVHFACMMIRRSLWLTHFQIANPLIYGDDESFYHHKAKELGLRKGYLVSHQCEHLARTPNSDPFYGAWKIFYLIGDTRDDCSQWRQSFRIGDREMEVFRLFNYPKEQIQLLKTLLAQN